MASPMEKRLPRTPIADFPRPPSGALSLRPPGLPSSTFLDDPSPVDESRARGRRARAESLVDHMLLSLDGYQNQPASLTHRALATRSQTLDEVPLRRALRTDDLGGLSADHGHLKAGRPRGHAYSISYSSEPDRRPDDINGRGAIRASHSRRADTGFTFPAVLERIDSFRAADQDGGRGFAAQRALPPSPGRAARHRTGRGPRTGKSSTSSSFDAGYVQLYGTARWTTAIERRPSSLDRAGNDRRLRHPPLDGLPSDHVAQAWSQSRFDDPDDAAPHPIVPAGPSRQHSPERPAGRFPLDAYRPTQRSMGGRADHTRLSRGFHLSKGNPDAPDPSNLKSRSGRGGTPSDLKKLPALPPPPLTDWSAPGPTVGYGKSASSGRTESGVRVKERRGFFRRMFGSSKNTILGHHPAPTSSHAIAEEGRSWRTRSRVGTLDEERRAAGRFTASSAYTEKELPVAPEQPPPLSKKTSSFFRRRKKSVSENRVQPRPPSPPQDASGSDPHGRPLSPVSSLRVVMDPYLQRSPTTPDILHGREDVRLGHEGETHQVPAFDRNDKIPSITATPSGAIDSEDAGDLQSEDGYFPRLAPPRRESEPQQLDDACHERDLGDLEQGKRPTTDSPVLTPMGVREISRRPTLEQLRSTSTVIVTHALETDVPDVTPSKPYLLDQRDLAQKTATEDAHRRIDDTTGDQAFKKSSTEALKALSTEHGSAKSSRVWLQPTVSEENLAKADPLGLEPRGPLNQTIRPSVAGDDLHAASSVPVEREEHVEGDERTASQEPHLADPAGTLDPTEGREQARRLFEGEEDVVGTQTAAEWLGEAGQAGFRVRQAFLELFDWSSVSILMAMRELCSKLVLKAETQRVDRILDAVSYRWCECNPNHGFKASDVVHTICYSILLLNTDLHVADIEQKMTRGQFIKNTMPTIRRVVEDAAPDAFEPGRASALSRSRISMIETGSPSLKPPNDTNVWEGDESRPSFEIDRRSRRSSFRPSHREDSRGRSPTPLGTDYPADDVGLLVKTPFYGTRRAWEGQVEVVLKSFFHSIRQQRLPLCGAAVEAGSDQALVSNPLSILAGNVLKRSPSTLSKANSENLTHRGRPELQRLGSTGRWGSKTRSRPRVYASPTVGSSRTSFEDHSSAWTPNSFTWSRYSLNKTQTSMSVGSVAPYLSKSNYQQSVGFANALNQAIVRDDDTATGSLPDDRTVPLLEDERLGLAGAPWAKEGIVQHKHHLDHVDRRAKDRNWSECFAVIEKGWMRLFSFSTKNSIRQRHKNRQLAAAAAAGSVVGGGNWTENAQGIGSFLLRQTIASELPPPGYSKSRPYVWALSLPTGGVHLFQVGTPEIVKEFVSTANYWSGRLSKEPLIGGISNVEYGWSDAVINQALVENHVGPPPGSSCSARPSLQGSIRSSMDYGVGGVVSSMRGGRLPGDRMTISDWNPPQQSMVASPLGEGEQLLALTTYVKNISADLQRHNELRGPMLLTFSNRSSNSTKAMTNWERKSCYLLREIVKFQTYIDALSAATLAATHVLTTTITDSTTTATTTTDHDDDHNGAVMVRDDAERGLKREMYHH